MTRYLGIDPGRDGAAVLVDSDGPRVVETLLFSECQRDGWDPRTLAHALREMTATPHGDGVYHLTPSVVALELYAGRAGEGGGSMLTIGRGWGTIHAVVSLVWPGAVVLTPASNSWTRMLRDLPGEGKARSVAFCSSHMPDLDLTPGRRRVPHSGLADATCLAWWAMGKGPGASIRVEVV